MGIVDEGCIKIGADVCPGHGSLREWGVSYRELPLTQDGQVDLRGLEEAVRKSHRASCAFNMCILRLPHMHLHMPAARLYIACAGHSRAEVHQVCFFGPGCQLPVKRRMNAMAMQACAWPSSSARAGTRYGRR